jgi:hypothetical protein
LPCAVPLVHRRGFGIDSMPEDSWTFLQRSSVKRESSKSN